MREAETGVGGTSGSSGQWQPEAAADESAQPEAGTGGTGAASSSNECIGVLSMGVSFMLLVLGGYWIYNIGDNVNLVKSLEEEVTALDFARPATCSFNKDPGTPNSWVEEYTWPSRNKDGFKITRSNEWTSVACAVTVSYVTEGNDEASVPGEVFAGADSTNQADRVAMCRGTLSGPWHNIMIQASWNQDAFLDYERTMYEPGGAAPFSSQYDGWACGRRNRVHSWELEKVIMRWMDERSTCSQDGMNKTSPDKLQDGGQDVCTVGKNGQVRLGTTDKQKQELEKTIEEFEAARASMIVGLAIVVSLLMGCCFMQCRIRQNRQKNLQKVECDSLVS